MTLLSLCKLVSSLPVFHITAMIRMSSHPTDTNINNIIMERKKCNAPS